MQIKRSRSPSIKQQKKSQQEHHELNKLIDKNLQECEGENNQPKHLSNTSLLNKLSLTCLQKLLNSQKISWSEQSTQTLTIDVLSTNFESMKLLLHHFNYKMKINVIFTHINSVFQAQDKNEEKGNFGVVKFVQFEDQEYAVKSVRVNYQNGQIDATGLYREFFMGFIAGVLGVGPKILPLFGYDIAISKNVGFFAMQKCDQLKNKKNKKQIMVNQLQSNLLILHSIKFIHHDIKPENIAYSNLLKKYVFIDFGLSRFIQEKPGEKTKTLFKGTLSYCSEAMIKCFYLNTPKFIDLYENDYHCLQKSYQYINPKPIESQKYFSRDPQFLTTEYSEDIEEDSHIFEDSILILRLKYFVQIQEIQQIVKILKNCLNIPKTAQQILFCPSIPSSITQNPQIQQRLAMLKQIIYKPGYRPNKNDDVLLNIFSTQRKTQIIQKLIPIKQMLKLSTDQFSHYLMKVQWVHKIFLYFDPFSDNFYYNHVEDDQVRKKIITKIYECMFDDKVRKQELSWQIIRQVLIFFYQNLKVLKNWQILNSLRQLFLIMEDFQFTTKLEDQIIDMIDQPTQKILTITQFTLLWQIMYEDYEHPRKQKWRQLVLKMSIPQNCNQITSKAHKIFTQINIKNRYIFYQQNEKKYNICSQLEDLSLICAQKVYRCYSGWIDRIKFLYYFVCKLYFKIPENFSPNLAFKTYYFIFFLPKVYFQQWQREYFNLFMPIRKQFNIKYRLKPSVQISQQTLQHFHKVILGKNHQFLTTDFFYTIDIVLEDKSLFYLEIAELNKYVKKIEDVEDLDNQIHKIHQLFVFFMYFSHLIESNQYIKNEYQKLQKFQIKYLHRQLEKVLNSVCSGQRFKNALNQCKNLQIQAKTLKIIFAILQDNTKEVIENNIKQTFNLIKPFPNSSSNIVKFFLKILYYFEKQLINPQIHYSQDIILQIGHDYLQSQHYCFFQLNRKVLLDVVRIRNQRMQHEYTIGLILQYIRYAQENWEKIDQVWYLLGLEDMTRVFCETIKQEKRKEIYQQLQNRILNSKYGLFRYFTFQILKSVLHLIDKVTQKKQLIKILLCIERMPYYYSHIKMKSDLYGLCRELGLLTTSRKFLICHRVEINSSNDRIQQMQMFLIELKKRISEKFQFQFKPGYRKLKKKVSKLNQIYSIK